MSSSPALKSRLLRGGVFGDFFPPDVGRIEGHYPTRSDFKFFQGSRIATNPRNLFPHFPLPETADEHRVTVSELILDNCQDLLNLDAGLLVGQPQLNFDGSYDVCFYHSVPIIPLIDFPSYFSNQNWGLPKICLATSRTHRRYVSCATGRQQIKRQQHRLRSLQESSCCTLN